DDVLHRLGVIIDDARRDGSRLGYFAALYRNVTAEVQRGIAAGRFADGARMARLDVVFANRYLDAYDAYAAGRPASRCWVAAFEAASRWPPLILQHLLLGMNAHIHLDLGIAAAEVAAGAELGALEGDFVAINALLREMIDDVQHRIAAVSPWMWIVDRIGLRGDETICGLCIGGAREVAWRVATRLAPLDAAGRAAEIARLDAMVAALAIPVAHPGLLARTALLGVRLREARDVGKVISALDARTPATLAPA
ncbi:MAG TPA: DUF5995 family protein, partial [Gemmatimonadaceae bacterium]